MLWGHFSTQATTHFCSGQLHLVLFHQYLHTQVKANTQFAVWKEVVFKIYKVGYDTRKNKIRKTMVYCAAVLQWLQKMFVTIDFLFLFVVQPYLNSRYRNLRHIVIWIPLTNSDHGIDPLVETFLHFYNFSM